MVVHERPASMRSVARNGSLLYIFLTTAPVNLLYLQKKRVCMHNDFDEMFLK
jgi:hypothetical protein